MSTDQYLLDRIQNVLSSKKIQWTEKRMFGGVCFMVDDKMCLGTFKDGLMVRIDPKNADNLLKKNHTEQMMMKDKVMNGYLIINAKGYDSETDLEFWIDECLKFNPLAKSSKKKIVLLI